MSKGILGLGNASTLFYIYEINRRFQLKNGGFSTCPFILFQVDFNEINPYLPDQFEILIPKIQNYFNEITKLGIEKILVPNITLHETLDKIETDLEIFHAIDLTIIKLIQNKISKVVLFGTIFTMNSSYFIDKFQQKNIEIIKPKKEDQLFIDDFRKKAYLKKETSEQILKFQNLCYLYSLETSVVLACSELSIHKIEIKNVFDMVEIQTEEFLK